MPNAVLRSLHELMKAFRSTPARAREQPLCPRGQEAIYASGLLSLHAGDLVSAATALPAKLSLEPAPSWLATPNTPPYLRLLQALGAAAALRAQATAHLLLAFVAVEQLSQAQWQQVLTLASAQALPLVIVAIPNQRPGWLSSHAQAWGVPGIPVDAADAVALYRVLQESSVRARHGDGPALLEPIPWTLPSSPGHPADPLRAMLLLLRRQGLLSPASRAPRPAQPRGK